MTDSDNPRRVLLKLSGEAFGGGKVGIDTQVIRRIAEEIVPAVQQGVQVAIVVGGGNFFRGAELQQAGIDRSRGDYMGMLGTVMNCLALQDFLEQEGQAVGYALLVFYWSCEAGGKTVQLEELYLSEQARGCGFGSQFMEWMLREYAGSAKRFRLEVCPRNQRVKKLYERYGFELLPYEQMVRNEG